MRQSILFVVSHKALTTFQASLIDGQVLESEGQAPIMSALREMVNVDLLKNKVFLLVGISNVFGMLGFYTPFVYLPNMAALRGIPLEDANFLIRYAGDQEIRDAKRMTITTEEPVFQHYRHLQHFRQSIQRLAFGL